jgi:signal peptidase I
MENTLLVNDMLLANKFIYRFIDPSRKDVIVFKNIDEKSRKSGKEFLSKRIIGMPGDKIIIKNGYVHINGKKLDEPYIKEKCNIDITLRSRNTKNIKSGKIEFQKLETGEVTIPNNHYFVMGDNRNNSRDSRFFGFIPRESIIAKPTLRYWPLKRIGFIH